MLRRHFANVTPFVQAWLESCDGAIVVDIAPGHRSRTKHAVSCTGAIDTLKRYKNVLRRTTVQCTPYKRRGQGPGIEEPRGPSRLRNNFAVQHCPGE